MVIETYEDVNVCIINKSIRNSLKKFIKEFDIHNYDRNNLAYIKTISYFDNEKINLSDCIELLESNDVYNENLCYYLEYMVDLYIQILDKFGDKGTFLKYDPIDIINDVMYEMGYYTLSDVYLDVRGFRKQTLQEIIDEYYSINQ